MLQVIFRNFKHEKLAENIIKAMKIATELFGLASQNISNGDFEILIWNAYKEEEGNQEEVWKKLNKSATSDTTNSTLCISQTSSPVLPLMQELSYYKKEEDQEKVAAALAKKQKMYLIKRKIISKRKLK